MENIVGEQGLSLQQHSPYKSSKLSENSNCRKLTLYARGLKLEHLGIFNVLFLFLRFLKLYRVRTGPGKPGKSWNFVVAFSRTGKSWKMLLVLESFGNLLNSSKKYEMYGRQQGELTLRSWD